MYIYIYIYKTNNKHETYMKFFMKDSPILYKDDKGNSGFQL